MLVLCLKQSDTDGQVDGHDPELDVAGIVPVQTVGDKDHEEVNMKDQKRRDGDPNVAHLDDRVLTVGPNDGAHEEEYERVHSSESNVRETETIPVVVAAPVMAVWIGVDHVCGGCKAALWRFLLASRLRKVQVSVGKASGTAEADHQGMQDLLDIVQKLLGGCLAGVEVQMAAQKERVCCNDRRLDEKGEVEVGYRLRYRRPVK